MHVNTWPPPSVQAGLIGEMMDDTFESLEDDDLEEEAGEAVEAILFEVTKGEICRMPKIAPSVSMC